MKSNKWTDIFVMIFSLGIIIASVGWVINSGMLNLNLSEDTKLSWHLVRSSGIVAYTLLVTSTIWGLFISSQFVKDWSPGPVSLSLHSALSWMAIIFALIHALLLLFDNYFTYTLSDIFVPFTGPYRPEVVGLGTLAFWILLIVSLSFPLKKRMGHANWKRLHYLSYFGFLAVTAHGIFAGTDGEHLGFRLLMGAGILIVVLLLGFRVGKSHNNTSTVPERPTTRERRMQRQSNAR